MCHTRRDRPRAPRTEPCLLASHRKPRHGLKAQPERAGTARRNELTQAPTRAVTSWAWVSVDCDMSRRHVARLPRLTRPVGRGRRTCEYGEVTRAPRDRRRVTIGRRARG